MKKISQPIVFFGNERLATGVATSAPTLQSLIAADYAIKAVVSNYEPGQSRSARALEIAEVAQKHNIPVIIPSSSKVIVEQLKDLDAQVGVLVAYGKIVPQSIIDIFPNGIVNIHPSLLPKGRGPTPIEQAILEGYSITGVSIMRLVSRMDAGPVYAQQSINLAGNETKQALADKLLTVGGKLLIDYLPKILDGSVSPIPQNDADATYNRLLTKADGVIDWHKPAKRIEREIRAYLEWPKSRAILAGKDVIITKAHAAPSNGTPGSVEIVKEANVLIVYCGIGYLCIECLKPAGKKEMSAAEFIRGYRRQNA